MNTAAQPQARRRWSEVPLPPLPSVKTRSGPKGRAWHRLSSMAACQVGYLIRWVGRPASSNLKHQTSEPPRRPTSVSWLLTRPRSQKVGSLSPSLAQGALGRRCWESTMSVFVLRAKAGHSQ